MNLKIELHFTNDFEIRDAFLKQILNYEKTNRN